MSVHAIFRQSTAALCAVALILAQMPQPVRAAPLSQRLAAYDYLSNGLEPYNELLGYLGSRLDRSVYEPAALSASLGEEPHRLFSFVRDDIAVRLYAGSLRGADGVLIDRSGNALDRSLLLAELLTQAGVESRILRGTLTRELADEVAARAFEASPQAPEALRLTPEILAALMDRLGLTADQIEEQVAGSFEESAAATEEVMELYRPAADSLLDTLARDGAIDIAHVETPDLAALATEHYWVQYRSEAGDWIDLDPILARMQPGESLVEADEVLAADTLPEDLVHRLKVKVTLTIAQGGEVEHVTLVEGTFDVPRLAGGEVMIANLPDGLTGDSLHAGRSWAEVAGGINEYSTVLVTADGIVGSPFFTTDGRLFNNPPGSDEGNAERTREAVGEAFESPASVLEGLFAPADDGSDDATPAPGRRVVGQSVEYVLVESRGRGREPEETRHVRDMLSPWVTTGWSPEGGPTRQLVERSDLELHTVLNWNLRIAPMGYEVPANYVTYRQIAFLAGSADSQDVLLRKMLELPPSGQATNPDRSLPWPLYALAASAHHLGDDVAERRDDVAFFVGAPSLLALETALRPDGDAPPILYEGIDLIALGHRAIAREPSEETARAGFERVLREGVLWTVLERTTIEDRARSAGVVEPDAHNLTNVFSAADSQGIGFASLDARWDPLERIDGLPVDPGIQAELARTAEQGYTMVLPDRTVDGSTPASAWWRVDPATGETIGVAPGGRGQSFWEYLKTTYKDLAGNEWYAYYFQVMFAVFVGLISFATCMVTGGHPGLCFVLALITALGVAPIRVVANFAVAILGIVIGAWAAGSASNSGGSGRPVAPPPSSTAPTGSGSVAPANSSSTATPDSDSTASASSIPAPPSGMTPEEAERLLNDLIRDMALGPYRVEGN